MCQRRLTAVHVEQSLFMAKEQCLKKVSLSKHTHTHLLHADKLFQFIFYFYAPKIDIHSHMSPPTHVSYCLFLLEEKKREREKITQAKIISVSRS